MNILSITVDIEDWYHTNLFASKKVYQKTFIKSKNMNTLSITVDIEDWYHKTFLQAKSFTKKTFIDKWTGKYDYLSLREPTKRVLDMLDEFDINATFFVDVVDHYPGLVESIQSNRICEFIV